MDLKGLFFFFLCLYIFPAAKAQTGVCPFSVSGYIRFSDTASMNPEAVSVFSRQTGKGMLTDSGGHFIFKNICAGKFSLAISAQGYRTLDTVLMVSDDLTIDLLLYSSAAKLDSVVVTGQAIRKDLITTAVQTSLAGKALEETHGLSLGESLKGIAGVNSIQTGPSISKPVIHGVYSNRILIMNNGVRQEGQNWGNDHAPEIDPFIATKLTVIKGAAAIRYGSDAIGGVVLVEPRDMRILPGIAGELNVVGMSNGHAGVVSGSVEGAASNKLQGLSWRMQGTLKKAGNAQAPDYYMGNTGFYENDYSLALKYAKTKYGAEIYFSRFDSKIGIATASHIGTLQDLYSAFNRPEPAVKADFTYGIDRPYQTVNHELVKASGFIQLKNNLGKIEGVYAFQRDIRKEYDADISFNDSIARLNPPDLYFQLNTSTADLIWEHPAIRKKITGSVGLNFITHGNLQEGTGYQELIPNFVDYGGGIFAIEKMELHKLIAEAGIRYDYKWLQAYTVDSRTLVKTTPTYSWQNVTVNAGAVYHFSENASATYNFGSAWRPPQVIELFANGIHQSAASYEHGDTSLTLEKAYNNNLAFTYHHSFFEAELGVYVNYFDHYIYLKPDSLPAQTIQGAFPSYTYTQVNALFEGLDLSMSFHFLKHFSLISKTSVVRARNLTIHDWLINIPADRFDNTIKYELASLHKLRNIFISINNLVVSKQTRVPPKSDYVPPPAGYLLWGTDIGASVPFAGTFMDLSLSVTNLANTVYRDYLNRFRYFIDDPGRNVSLRIKIPLDFSKKQKTT